MIERVAVDRDRPDPEAISRAADVIRRGGIVAYPTETLYGLAVDPRDARAVEKLFTLKGRDRGVAIPLIAADLEQARAAGMLTPIDERMAAAFWPGPLTIVVPARPAITSLVTAGRGTVGVRVSAHAVARALAAGAGTCITATSANRSGEAAYTTADEVAAALRDGIDLLLDAGPTPGGAPSTVVEIVDGRPTLHRAGAIDFDRVLRSAE